MILIFCVKGYLLMQLSLKKNKRYTVIRRLSEIISLKSISLTVVVKVLILF